MPTASPRPRIPLRRWAWQAFVRTSVAPLILVELVLILVYVATNLFSYRQSVESLHMMSEAELARIAQRETAVVSERLTAVSRVTEVLAARAGSALATPYTPPPEELARYAMTEGGAYATIRDAGDSAAMFFSGVVPVGPAEREKAHRLPQIDAFMRDIKATNPAVVQLYVNTFDSLNRIYPYMDTVGQYPPKMDIPSYNFYYAADAAHNPTRHPMWTDAYLDPAGAGWIVSSIAPVYRGDTLEAVVGIDMTLATVVQQVLQLEVPWGGYGVLVGKDGTLIALPPAGEVDWGVRELTQGDYPSAVLADTLKPDDFNLFKAERFAEAARLVGSAPAGVEDLTLNVSKVVAWTAIPETGWRLLVVVPRANIYANAQELRGRVTTLSLGVVGGLLAFYIVFVLVLLRRASREAEVLVAPLHEITRLAREIGAGAYHQAPLDTPLEEIQAVGDGVVRMGRELGERVELLQAREAELRATKEVAENANRAKTEFLAKMSHEIRTPLNGVMGFIDLVLATPLLDRQREFLGFSRSSANNLLAIINDILDVSKIEAGRMELESVPFEPRRLVGEVVALVRLAADARGLTIETRIAPNVPAHVLGDPTRLSQVLVNLFSNAVKFTVKGTVTLTVERRTPATSRPDLAGGPIAELVFSVRDTGIGIEPAHLATIFQAFRQADDTITRRFGGTGLGLTISSHLIGMMGGELAVESTPGVGSTFAFAAQFRTVDVVPAVERPVLPPRASVATGRRVLVAEDDPTSQLVAERMLAILGYTAEVVSDGLVALERLEAGGYDLALLDIKMPRMDGLAVARAWRAREAARGLPRLRLVAVSANVYASDVAESLNAGFDGHIPKPLALRSFRERMAELDPSP
jgi:signal transduction histidine kinase